MLFRWNSETSGGFTQKIPINYPAAYHRGTMSNGISAGNLATTADNVPKVEPIPLPKAEKQAAAAPEAVEAVKDDEEQPPPIPPMPEMYQDEAASKPESENEEPEEELDQFESCCNTTNEENYLTPANELSLNPQDLQDQDDIPLADHDEAEAEAEEPLATSSPATAATVVKETDKKGHITSTYIGPAEVRSPTESEKSFIQKCSDVKLTDDEIMRIYHERNPLERLAKFNSLKRKQSSVVHDMILSNSANKPRARRTRVAVPSSSIPPVPSAASDAVQVQVTPVRPPRLRTSRSEPPMSLPATPLTDPAKFGIPVARNAKKSLSTAAAAKIKNPDPDIERHSQPIPICEIE